MRPVWNGSMVSAIATAACCGPPCKASGAATGPIPPPEETDLAVDAAIRHVGLAACDLAIVPIEDVLGLREQPNLPGTLDEHPNWRRRIAGNAATVLDGTRASARLRDLDSVRKRP